MVIMRRIKNDGRLIEAGMFDAYHPDSLLVGSLPLGQLSIPKHIELAGNALYWYDDPLDDYRRDKVHDKGALNAFARIKTSDDILRFARRYGPLGLCKHARPPMHRGKDGERRWCAPFGSEPIKRWFDYIGLVDRCLNFAAQMKIDSNNIRIPTKYFKRIASNPPANIPNVKMVPARGFGKWLVADTVNEWLGDAGIRLELNWDSEEPVLILTGGSVFGALGVQLLSSVTSNTLAVCSGCGKPYLRKGRKPQPGRRNYCPTCGDRVASKLRQRRRRERAKRQVVYP